MLSYTTSTGKITDAELYIGVNPMSQYGGGVVELRENEELDLKKNAMKCFQKENKMQVLFRRSFQIVA